MVLLTLLGTLGLAPAVNAHTGGTMSYSNWGHDDSELRAQLRVRAVDFRQLPTALMSSGLAAFVSQHSKPSDDGACQAQVARSQTGSDGWMHIDLNWHCKSSPATIEFRWLAFMPGHLHLLRRGEDVQLIRGGEITVLTWAYEEPRTVWQEAAKQWQHGLRHIASGWDHLAFLLGLLLLARSLGAMAVLITGFTIGHSLSLILATSLHVLPPSVTVELAIAASIVFIALPTPLAAHHNLRHWLAPITIAGLCCALAWAQPDAILIWLGLFLLALSHRAFPPHQATLAQLILASVFGLMHGFGFAAEILAHADAAAKVWPILLGFNLGVETGQLIFVIPAWVVLRISRRFGNPHQLLQSCVLGVGGFALFSRLVESYLAGS